MSHCDAFGICPQSEVASALPPMLSRSALLHLPLGFCPVLCRKQVCVFSPEPEWEMQEKCCFLLSSGSSARCRVQG